jgi:hypothetical protein
MNKPVAVLLAIIGWAGVALVENFSKLVPHASPQEVAPFVWPVRILAIVLTVLAVQTFIKKPAATKP